MEGEDNHNNHNQDPSKKESDWKLKVKLKIGPQQPPDAAEKKEHYCAPCNKWFSSGKAFGGHMSSAHVQANREYSYKSKHRSGDDSCFDEDKEKTCPICGKDFPSTKSLFGHMRCHPDRAYRGMEPPLRAKNKPEKFKPRSQSHSQEYSGEEENKVETHKDIVDLQARLWSWMATDKRGRSPIKRRTRTAEDEEERQLYEAVRQLVSLGNGNPNPSQIGGKRNGIVISPISSLALNHDDHQQDEDGSGDEDDDSSKKKKRRIDEFSPESSGGGGRFKCSDCSKSFDSHQALGGHKSSHNKFKLSIQNDCPNQQHHSTINNQSNVVVTPPQIEANNINNNIDDHPSCSAPVGGYECGVCHKIFPTRRALGGHKKCHNNNAQSSDSAPVQQQQQQEQQNDDHHRRILDFDLNEIPENNNNNVDHDHHNQLE